MIVLDASAMVDALVGDPVDRQLLELLAEEDLHAPALLDFEVASALRGLALAKKLARRRVAEAVEDFGLLRIERHPMTDLLANILDLRERFTVSDASYVVLARALDAPLVTADGKLREAARTGIDVRLFGATSR